jgi:CHAT domain-containing protein/tetratricopeptide (TPR) repeat protein
MRRVLLSLCLPILGLVLAADDPPTDREAEARRVAERFYAAYAGKDLGALKDLWHPDAPDRKGALLEFERLFAATGSLTQEELSIDWVSVQGSRARIDVSGRMVGKDTHTGGPHERLGAFRQVLELARAGRAWKVERFEHYTEYWARVFLLELKTRPERTELLAREPRYARMVVSALNDAAITRSKEKRFDEAMQLSDAALEAADILGSIEDRAWCTMLRGLVLARRGDHPAAITEYEKAIGSFRERKVDAGVAIALGYLGRSLVQTGKGAKAAEAFAESKKLLYGLVYTGVDRASEVYYTVNVHLRWLERADRLERSATRQYEDSQPAEAVATVEELLRFEKALFGEVHDNVANSWSWVARLEAERADFDKALQAIDKAIAIRTRLHGDRSGQVLSDRLKRQWLERLRALTPEERKRYWSAEREARQARRLSGRQEYAEAERLWQRVAAVRRELLGPESPSCLDAEQDLARLLERQRKFAAAITLYRRLDPLLRKVYGDRHAETTDNLRLLARAQVNQAEEQVRKGEYAAAKDAVAEALTLRTGRLGGSDEGFRGGGNFVETIAQLRWYQAHVERLAALPEARRKTVRDALARLEQLKGEWVGRGHWKAEELAAALERTEQARASLRADLGDTDYAYVTNVVVAWAILLRSPRSAEVEESARQVLVALDRVGLRDDPCYTLVEGFLALAVYSRGGTLGRSGGLLLSAYERLRRVLGEEDSSVTLFREMLIVYHAGTGDWERVTALLQGLVEYYRRDIVGDAGEPDVLSQVQSLDRPAGKGLERSVFQYVTCSSLLATSKLVAGDVKGAEASLLQNVHITRKVFGDQSRNHAEALADMGDLYHTLGDLKRAEDFLRQAQNSLGNPDGLSRDTARKILIKLGAVRHDQGDFAGAEDALRGALSLLNEGSTLLFRDRQKCLKALARTLWARGRGDKALAALEEALDAELHSASEDLWALPTTALSGYQPGQGLDLDDLVSMVTAGKPSADRVKSLWTWVLRRRGATLDALCRLREAESACAGDPALNDRLERLHEVQRRLADVALNATSAVFREQQLRQRRRLEEEASQLESDLKQELSRRHPERSTPVPDVTLAAVQQRLPTGTALIEFVKYRPTNFRARPGEKKTEPRYLALVLPGGAAGVPQLFDLGEAGPIDDGVEAVRKAIEEFPQAVKGSSEASLEADFCDRSRVLHTLVLGKLGEALAGCTTLLVVPDGRLAQLPFSALVEGEGDKAHYLAERCRIGYLAAGRDLLRPPPSVTGRGVVVFAAPDFEMSTDQRLAAVRSLPRTPETTPVVRGRPVGSLRKDWGPLDQAEGEGKDIREVLDGGRLGPVIVYQGPEALEERLKQLHSPHILHLATHGFYYGPPRGIASGLPGRDRVGALLPNADDPLMRSGVVLAGANRPLGKVPDGKRVEDGWLTAAEAALLDLRGTELVVLSACETGLGDVQGAEGVYGLRRALLHAGARSLVVSLFQIPDVETRPLIKAFYQGLAKGKGRLEALSQADAEKVRERRKKIGAAHPFSWSSLVLVGDPDLGTTRP